MPRNHIDRLSPACCCGVSCKVGSTVIWPSGTGSAHPLRRWNYIEPECLNYEAHSSFPAEVAEFDLRFHSIQLCGALDLIDYRVISEGGPSLTRITVQAPRHATAPSGASITVWDTVAEYESGVSDETGPLALTERNDSGITGTVDRKPYTDPPDHVRIVPVQRNQGWWHFPGSKSKIAKPLPEPDDCYLLSWRGGSTYTFVAEANENLDIGPNTITVQVMPAVQHYTGPGEGEIEVKRGTETLFFVPGSVRRSTGDFEQFILKRDGDILWFFVLTQPSGALTQTPPGPGFSVGLDGRVVGALSGFTPSWDLVCEGYTGDRITTIDGFTFNEPECLLTDYQRALAFAIYSPNGLSDGRHFGVIDADNAVFQTPGGSLVEVPAPEGHQTNEGLFRQRCADSSCEWGNLPPPEIAELFESFDIEFGDGGYAPDCFKLPLVEARSILHFGGRYRSFMNEPEWDTTNQHGCSPCFKRAIGAALVRVGAAYDFDGESHNIHIQVEFHGKAIDENGEQDDFTFKSRKYRYLLKLGDAESPVPNQITLTEVDADQVDDSLPGGQFGLLQTVSWDPVVQEAVNECPAEAFTITMSRES